MKSFLAVAGCVLLIASAAVFSPYTLYGDLWLAMVLLVAGGVLVVVGLRGGQFDLILTLSQDVAEGSKPPARLNWKAPEGASEIQPKEQVKDFQAERMERVHGVMAGVGVVLLVLLAAINGGVLKDAATTDVQFALLVAGVGLLILGLGAARVRLGRIERADAVAWGIVVVLTLIALLLRLWQLNQMVRFFVDELAYSSAVENMWARDTVELIAPMEGTAAFPNLFAYFESKTVEVLGRNLAGFRAASALAGALTVPALYLLARALFKRRVALVAAALLVTFPPHLHFSRLGIIEATGALFGLVALAFLMRGFQHNRRLDWAAGGALLGLTHYFHEGARVLFTPVALVALVLLLMIWRPPNRVKNLLLAGVLTGMVALPIYTTLALMHFSAAARFNTPYISLDGEYWRELFASGDFYWHIRWHIFEPFLIFVHQRDRGLFYAGYTPMLLDWLVPAFLLGVWVVIWKWRTPAAILLLGWVLAVIFGNTLLMQSTIMTRYVVVFPAVMLLTALGVWTAVEMVGAAVARLRQKNNAAREGLGRSIKLPLQIGIVVVIVLVMSVAQVRYYFDLHVPLYNVQFRSNWGHRDAQDAVLRSLDFPAGTQIHIVSRKEPDSYHTRGLLTFHRGGDVTLDLLTPEQVDDEFLSGLKRDVDQAFFIDPNEPALLARLEAHFAVGEPEFSPYDLPARDQFALYYARATE